MKKFITKRRIFCAAVVLAVIIVPFLYSYFYLGAFWDPYSKLEALPVAVVNKDKGAEVDGKQRNLGEEMCDRLKDDGSLKFTFTDAADAKSGTEGSTYYATITIPENFSENIASADSDDKQTATITFSPNEKRNFLASQILSRAILQVEEETRSTVDKELVQKLADNVKSLPDRLTELQDGLGKLSDGSSDLVDGTKKLKDGTSTLYDGTSTLADGSKTLLNGSQKLANGTGTLLDGTDTLLSGTNDLAKGTKTYYSKFGEFNKGIGTLKKGASSLSTGAASLKEGTSQLKSGTDQLVEKTKNLGQITSGAKTLSESTKTFDTGIKQYTTGVNTLISTVSSTSTFLTQYVKANPALMKDPAFAEFISKLSDPAVAKSIQSLTTAGTTLTTASSQLSTGAEQLYQGTTSLPDLNTALVALNSGATQVAEGSDKLATGAATLSTGAAKVSSAADKLYTAADGIADGASKVNSGAAKLNSGVKDLNSGADTLYGGVTDLSSGASKLNSGAKDLNKGVTDLNDGANKLSDGIDEAKSGVNDSVDEANDQVSKLDGLADFAAEPVSIDQQNLTTIPNYGTAFAPYFMSLSLWVGALILFVGIYLDTEGRFKILSRESNHKVVRSFMFLLIGFAQAIALALVVHKGLGLKVENIALFYASICLVSMVFIAMVQFFMVHLKSAGKLISIVLLILQLTSCGGTFPMELVPKMFNDLYPYMPMTYSVALFKQAISDTDTNAVLYNGGVLLAILVVFMALTIVLSAIKTKKSAKEEVQMPVQFE